MTDSEIVEDLPKDLKVVSPQERIVPGVLDPEIRNELMKIKVNSRLPHSGIELLRFYDVDDEGNPKRTSPAQEKFRNEVWQMSFEDQMKVRDIAHHFEVTPACIYDTLRICKARYDEWMNRNGLKLYGTANQRLVDHITRLETEWLENQLDLEQAETAKDRSALRRLGLEILREIAKFKAIQPPDVVFHDHNHTIADESRRKLKEMFG